MLKKIIKPTPKHKPAVSGKQNMISRFRKYSLALAESFDAWRVAPRMVLIIYSALVMNLYLWFKSIPTFVQEKCDPQTLKVMLDLGKSLDDAKLLACSVVDVVGGPTTTQSAFVTTIVGLSTAIFALYTSTGRRWDSGLPPDINTELTNHAPPTVTVATVATVAAKNPDEAATSVPPPETESEAGDDGNGPKF